MGKIEIKNWEYLSERSQQDAAALAEQAEVHHSSRHAEMGMTYQKLAYGLVRTLRTLNPVIVETGVNSGLSTYYMLAALADRVDGGALISCDPQYKNQDDAMSRVGNVDLRAYWKGKIDLFKNWHFFSGKSLHVFAAIAEKFPEWDVFVHDSDHSRENMRYELKFAWDHLKPGGYLVIDDPTGTSETGTHDEVGMFLALHDVDWTYLDQAIVCRKPDILEGMKVTVHGGEATLTPEHPDLKMALPFVVPTHRVPLDELAKIDPAANLDPEAAEAAELAAQEAVLAKSLFDNPPPLPGVTPEVFEQPEENEKTDEDAELDAIIGNAPDDEDDVEDKDDGEYTGDEVDDAPDSKGRQ